LNERYQVARSRGDLESAKKFFTLITNTERQLSQGNDCNLVFCGEFAEILLESGDLEKAYEQAQIGETNSKEYHSEMVKCLCVMVRVHLIQDEFEMAIEKFDQAIAILNYQHGQHSPLHTTVYNTLGRSYLDKGRLEDAMILYKLSLGCCFTTLGPLHPCTGSIFCCLGQISLGLEQYDDALKFFQQAYHIEFSRTGGSLISADLQNLMSVVFLRLGDLDEASNALFSSLSIYESQGGDFCENLIECYLQIGQICEIKQDYKTILEHSNKAFKILVNTSLPSKSQNQKKLLDLTLKAVVKSFTPEKLSSLETICQSLVDSILVAKEESDIQEFFEKSRLSKNLQNFLKETLNSIYQRMKERNLLLFCKDYAFNVENLDDDQLKESLQAFEMLIKIQGGNIIMENFRNSSI